MTKTRGRQFGSFHVLKNAKGRNRVPTGMKGRHGIPLLGEACGTSHSLLGSDDTSFDNDEHYNASSIVQVQLLTSIRPTAMQYTTLL